VDVALAAALHVAQDVALIMTSDIDMDLSLDLGVAMTMVVAEAKETKK
jgi:hypothetical protein